MNYELIAHCYEAMNSKSKQQILLTRLNFTYQIVKLMRALLSYMLLLQQLPLGEYEFTKALRKTY